MCKKPAPNYLKCRIAASLLTAFSVCAMAAAPVFAEDGNALRSASTRHRGKHSQPGGEVTTSLLSISTASWRATRNTLTLAGQCAKGDIITVRNADSGEVLGRTRRAAISTSWALKITRLSPAPCRVRAEAGSKFAEEAVSGAPATCTNPPVTPPPTAGSYQVLGFNDLGMHCYDRDFSVLSLLPPFNNIHALVIKKGSEPSILNDTQVSVTYEAVADAKGSRTTTSVGKTNFWDNIYGLFGVTRAVDVGILGAMMPGAANTPQPMGTFDTQMNWFTALGIPIVAIDDMGVTNDYPMMRITAKDKASGTVLATTDIVLPVSAEMHCSSCHAEGGVAANSQEATKYGIAAWSIKTDSEQAFRQNILILHDAKHNTNLMSAQPVLCASCHYSPALDLAGTGPQGNQIGKPLLSAAIHSRHGETMAGTLPNASNPAIIPEDGTTSCYFCHPGSTTKCLRGAMANAGLTCQNCHGGLLAVSGAMGGNRTPWVNEPTCQSCHTGDAVSHLGSSIRGTVSYNPADPTATPLVATNKRFAEEDNTLYRNSRGHSGIACEGCHGSTHAEWPSLEANDNVAATQIQGHAGTIIECGACHGTSLALTTDGPHGMHNVNDKAWSSGGHRTFYKRDAQSCKACHGSDLRGTVLSRAAVARQLYEEDNRTVAVAKGTQIGCGLCHDNPLTGDSDPAPTPTPTPTPAPGSPDGANLYTAYCATCHRALATSSKRGVSSTSIQQAITADRGGMGSLTFLSTAQIDAIAYALSH